MANGSVDNGEVINPRKRKRGQPWTEEETQLLLQYRRSLHDRFLTTLESHQHLWQIISDNLCGENHQRSPAMCKEKWHNLKRDYRNLNQRNIRPIEGLYKDFEDVFLPHHHQIQGHAQQGDKWIVITSCWTSKAFYINGCTSDEIKESVRSEFRLNTKPNQQFWVTDEEGVVRCFHPEMPLGRYSLHVDPGLTTLDYTTKNK